MTMIPPHSEETERVILGSIVIDNALVGKTVLTPVDFYYPRHQEIFAACLALRQGKAPIDLITLGQKLSQEDVVLVNDCTTLVGSTANFSYFEDQVRQMAVKRRLQKLSLSIAELIGDIPLDDAVGRLRNGISEANSRMGGRFTDMRDFARESLVYIERRAKSKGELSGIPSGLKQIDSVTDGFQLQEYYVIAGRPGTGKSALALYCAQSAAARNFPVGVISLEMGDQQLQLRSMASLSGVPLWKLKRGALGREDWEKIYATHDRMESLPIYFEFSAYDSSSISRAVNSMIDSHGCKLVILDYIQLAKGYGASREREVAEISWLLKTLAQTNQIAVIGLAQLNRNPEREKRMPILADLRESGALEQDADVVVFLHRDEKEGKVLQVIFAKGRNIGSGKVRVFFDPQTMTFGDLDEPTGKETPF